jgi:hypothetical protein
MLYWKDKEGRCDRLDRNRGSRSPSPSQRSLPEHKGTRSHNHVLSLYLKRVVLACTYSSSTPHISCRKEAVEGYLQFESPCVVWTIKSGKNLQTVVLIAHDKSCMRHYGTKIIVPGSINWKGTLACVQTPRLELKSRSMDEKVSKARNFNWK